MDNKVLAEAQFCSQQNLDYLRKEMHWPEDGNDLKSTVRNFINNYKAQITTYSRRLAECATFE